MADKLSTTYSGKVSEDRISRMSTLLLAIRKERGISIDELCQHCNMDYNIVATLVRTLEADGFITIDLMQRCCILSRK
jgi:predicted transcriptional regulator